MKQKLKLFQLNFRSYVNITADYVLFHIAYYLSCNLTTAPRIPVSDPSADAHNGSASDSRKNVLKDSLLSYNLPPFLYILWQMYGEDHENAYT